MRPALFLRIASVVALVQFLAHGFLIVSYVPRHGAEEIALVEEMKSHYFFQGLAPHSYWDLYSGYAFFAALNCLIEAVLFWQLAAASKRNPAGIKPIVALFLVANLAYGALILNYFFLVPFVPDMVIAACLAAAFATSGSSEKEMA